MDRLDSWLNRQRGLRRILLGWLHMCIPAIALASAWWGMFGPGTPGLGIAFLKVVACSALAAMLFTGLIAYRLRTHPVRNADRPAFSWRLSAGVLLAAASSTFILMAASRYRRSAARQVELGNRSWPGE